MKLVTVADNLEHPWGMAFVPDGSLPVTERPGRLRIVSMDGRVSAPIVGVPRVYAVGQGGLLDVAIDPQFTANGLVHLWPLVSYDTEYSGEKISDSGVVPGVTAPVHYWVSSIATSGLLLYTGSHFPAWRGSACATSSGVRMVTSTCARTRVTGACCASSRQVDLRCQELLHWGGGPRHGSSSKAGRISWPLPGYLSSDGWRARASSWNSFDLGSRW